MTKEHRKTWNAFRRLIARVRATTEALDATMKQPESGKRGERIGQIVNILETDNDSALYWGLGISYTRDAVRMTPGQILKLRPPKENL